LECGIKKLFRFPQSDFYIYMGRRLRFVTLSIGNWSLCQQLRIGPAGRLQSLFLNRQVRQDRQERENLGGETTVFFDFLPWRSWRPWRFFDQTLEG